jgi:uncharacterized protein YqgC (DUF456 family)
MSLSSARCAQQAKRREFREKSRAVTTAWRAARQPDLRAYACVAKLRFTMDSVWYLIGAGLIVAGLVGAVVPVLPGIPMIFGGIWLIAGVDGYRHLGRWWLIGIGSLAALGVIVDLVAGALGAKRVGASPQAVAGALLGTLVGLLFGLPGLLLGPFLGAVLGELVAGKDLLRSTHVGVGATIGFLLGAIVKLAVSVLMLALFAAAWWWNRSPS